MSAWMVIEIARCGACGSDLSTRALQPWEDPLAWASGARLLVICEVCEAWSARRPDTEGGEGA